MSSEERALQCLGSGKLCSRRCRVRPVIVMITGRFFVFEGGVNGDYGSGERDLQYFRKVGAGRESEELGLRKWEEKSALLP